MLDPVVDQPCEVLVREAFEVLHVVQVHLPQLIALRCARQLPRHRPSERALVVEEAKPPAAAGQPRRAAPRRHQRQRSVRAQRCVAGDRPMRRRKAHAPAAQKLELKPARHLSWRYVPREGELAQHSAGELVPVTDGPRHVVEGRGARGQRSPQTIGPACLAFGREPAAPGLFSSRANSIASASG